VQLWAKKNTPAICDEWRVGWRESGKWGRDGTGDGMGRERERRKYGIDFGSETPCTSARQWRRQDFVSGGAQVWRREKTENNKCMSYHTRRTTNNAYS